MGYRTLGIMGAGGLAREVLELAQIINSREKRWDNFVFIDLHSSDEKVNGISVCDYDQAKSLYAESGLEAIVGIGEPKKRETLFGDLERDGIPAATLIHPDVHIPATTSVGKGVVIQYGCFISCNVSLGDYVYIQPQCNIGHDDVIGEGCMIAGFGNVAGKVHIGKWTYVGLSTAVREAANIGEYSVIGMGSVVQRDIPYRVIAMGNPARPFLRNEGGKILR